MYLYTLHNFLYNRKITTNRSKFANLNRPRTIKFWLFIWCINFIMLNYFIFSKNFNISQRKTVYRLISGKRLICQFFLNLHNSFMNYVKALWENTKLFHYSLIIFHKYIMYKKGKNKCWTYYELIFSLNLSWDEVN